MPTQIGSYQIILKVEDLPGGGHLCYPTIHFRGLDVTSEALSRIFPSVRNYFEGLDREAAQQHAVEQLRPILEEWDRVGFHENP